MKFKVGQRILNEFECMPNKRKRKVLYILREILNHEEIVLGRLMKLLCLVSVCDSDTGNITTARAFEFNSKERTLSILFHSIHNSIHSRGQKDENQ